MININAKEGEEEDDGEEEDEKDEEDKDSYTPPKVSVWLTITFTSSPHYRHSAK